MGGMIYLALNKGSSLHIRLASLGSLAVMVLTLIICVIAYVNGGDAPVDWSTYVVSDAPPEPAKKDTAGTVAIVFTILFFLALFVIILALAMREHKKNAPKKEGLII